MSFVHLLLMTKTNAGSWMSSWQLMSLVLIVVQGLLKVNISAQPRRFIGENSSLGMDNEDGGDGLPSKNQDINVDGDLSRSSPSSNPEETIPQSFLRKYLSHARDACHPRLHSIDQDKISRLYADLRRESTACGGVPVAVRHLESLMRMAEAHVQGFGVGLIVS